MAPTDADLTSIALETLREGLIVADAHGRIVLANASARALGCEATVGAPAASLALLDPAGAPLTGARHPLARALAGESLDIHVRLPGDARLFGCTAWPLGPEPKGALLKLRDLTVLQRTEEELGRLAQFLDSVVENIPDMIFVKEAHELRFERVNAAGERLLGVSREALLGHNDYDFFPKDQADFFTKVDRDTLARGELVDIPEEPIQTLHGERWLHTKKIPLLDKNGVPQYLLGISSDITERKSAEEALQRANAELEQRIADAVEALRRTEEQLLHAQKMEAIGRLAGGIAHDFNNMLTVIRSFTELMMAKKGDATSHLTQVARATDRAADLTSKLLAFSRQQVLQPQTLDPNEIFRDMTSMLQTVVGEDIVVEARLGTVGTVSADRGQIEQVVLNLAVNARDAMPEGGRLDVSTREEVLAAGAHAGLAPGAYVVLAVADTGGGMTPEVHARLFEPFFTTKPRGKGTGLGLATSYGIVRQSGGDMVVHTAVGAGTTVEIWLPCAKGRVVTRRPKRRLTPKVREGGAAIFVVEDEPLVRQTVATVLSEAGYHVIEARDGFDALRQLREGLPEVDLLLTDVVMPGMSGRRLVEFARSLRPDLRVMMMSGYTADIILDDLGDTELLPKPFSPDVLLAAVARALAGSS